MRLLTIVLLSLIWISNGVIKFTFKDRLIIWLYDSKIFRITTLPDSTVYKQPEINSLIVTYKPSDAIPYNISTKQTNKIITVIQTEDMYVEVNTNTLQVSFFDSNNCLLTEAMKSFILKSDPVTQKPIYKVLQEWYLPANNTAIYGLGLYQSGIFNLLDTTVRCVQFNTEICIPYIVTNKFYGILWDSSYGVTTLNSQNINITNWTLSKTAAINNYNISTTFTANANIDGYYTYFMDFASPYSFGVSYRNDTYFWAFYIKTANSDQFVLHDMFGPVFIEMPSSFAVPGIYLKQGQSIEIKINFQNITRIPSIYYRGPTGKMDLESLEAQYIDYYYIFAPMNSGNRFDKLMAGYRLLTGGKIGLFSLNVYGFWQSQNRYYNQSQLLQDAAQYRQRKIPIDNIVQDFKYWGNSNNWGPHFNLSLYPNPLLMVDELHGMNIRFMISVWPRFGTNTTFYSVMKENNWLVGGSTWTNVYDENATTQFYEFVNDSMYNIGVDYIWLDSSEPDNFPQVGNLLYDSYTKTNISGDEYENPYCLLLLKSMCQNYIEDYNNKRPFFLTRSSFASQQTSYSAVWSGDITSSWDTFKKQIISSLTYQLSGHAYVANDIGGFYRPDSLFGTASGMINNTEYKRLLIRWFQFGCFLPIYRVHASHVQTAIWNYGNIVEQNILIIHNLRYRLLPYIYSLSYLISEYNYTLQRALIFDFYDDENVYDINDQFMFGPFLLISPVYDDNNQTDIYLPSKYKYYYDFWNGKIINGGQWLYNKSISLNETAIHVHCGSILILGPFVQYSTQIPWVELEIRIYTGNNASFVLYEDNFVDRLSIAKSAYSITEFYWNDDQKEMYISDRKGLGYDGMIMNRIFNFVIVNEYHGVGINVTDNVDASVEYQGKKMTVTF